VATASNISINQVYDFSFNILYVINNRRTNSGIQSVNCNLLTLQDWVPRPCPWMESLGLGVWISLHFGLSFIHIGVLRIFSHREVWFPQKVHWVFPGSLVHGTPGFWVYPFTRFLCWRVIPTGLDLGSLFREGFGPLFYSLYEEHTRGV